MRPLWKNSTLPGKKFIVNSACCKKIASPLIVEVRMFVGIIQHHTRD